MFFAFIRPGPCWNEMDMGDPVLEANPAGCEIQVAQSPWETQG